MALPKRFDEADMQVLYSEEEIAAQVKKVALQVMESYAKDDRQVLCVCVLKGAVMFYAELMKELKGRDYLFDFITLSSYRNEVNSSGNVKLVSNITESVKDRHVLIVEDIIDSGFTLQFLRKYFNSLGAIDVKVASLIDKPKARKVDENADFVAFTLTDSPFIIGYGLDYAQQYRNLKEIWAVDVKRFL